VRAAHPGQRARVCHGGALDPFAEGLLILLVGAATRLFDHLHAIPKTYEATVRWGVETDNGDPLGATAFAGDPSALTPERLEAALGTFVGWNEQVPPATSNKRVGGERAYEKAHRGEAVELPPSRVYLHEARWLSHDLPRESRVRVVVRGGYYVRALGRDLGRLLGCGAHLGALHRTAIGPYVDPGVGRRVEVRGRDVLSWTPGRTLTDQEFGEVRQGREIAVGAIEPAEWGLPEGFPGEEGLVRGFHLGRLVCLLGREGERLRVAAGFGRGI
jgi:tRNA pseudouridine55 synthase